MNAHLQQKKGKQTFSSPPTGRNQTVRFNDHRPQVTHQLMLQQTANTVIQRAFAPSQVIQRRDFGKYPANEKIDPNKVGVANNGIRKIPTANERPDDVPLKQPYRLAMHKLHDVVLVLEDANKKGANIRSPDPEKLRGKMVAIQKKGKDLAKTYKAGMRDLTSTAAVGTLKQQYHIGMNALIVELDNNTREGENVIKKHHLVGARNTLSKKGTNLWRQRWLKTKSAVNRALTSKWGAWETKLKNSAKNNIGIPMPQANWAQKVTAQKWDIFYGGSLMKGYKGPPKQNTRFLASNFDVDANMDAPAIATYLINVKGNTVDRGQLDPSNAPETRVKDMDNALDQTVKHELVKSKLAKDASEVNKIVSEPFETRINAPKKLGKIANKEVKRSEKEQIVRDRLTGIRKKHPAKMTAIGAKLQQRGLLDATTHSLVSKVLTPVEINTINQIISTT